MGNPSRVVSGLEGSLKKTNEELRTENLNLKDQLAASLARADKEAALAKRLATGWPIGQPVASPSEISFEQQTEFPNIEITCDIPTSTSSATR